MEKVVNWLSEGPEWIRFRVMTQLAGKSAESPEAMDYFNRLGNDPQIKLILAELKSWPGDILKSHNDAKHPIHKLAFLADIGLDAKNSDIAAIISGVLSHKAPEGPFQIMVNIPKSFGGSGTEQWSWMLCDAPLVLYSLVKFGLGSNPEVLTAVDYLAGLIRDNGWPCTVSPDLGKFRGPGRKTDLCPYATLLMLKLLAQLPEYHNTPACKMGAEAILTLWEKRRESRPYLFAMGTGFSKLKGPLIWYDTLHVLDVLSRFEWLQGDSRLHEIAQMVNSKKDADGFFTAESVWKAWADWEFGQKKSPSRWITLIAYGSLYRLHML